MIEGHRDMAVIIDIPRGDISQMMISAYKPLSSTTDADIHTAYLLACDSLSTGIHFANPIFMDSHDNDASVSVPKSKYDTLRWSLDHFIPVSNTTSQFISDKTSPTMQ